MLFLTLLLAFTQKSCLISFHFFQKLIKGGVGIRAGGCKIFQKLISGGGAISRYSRVPRKKGGRGLVAIEDCVQIAILGLENYVQDSRERILSSARYEAGERVTEKDFQKRRREERRSELQEKALHSQFFRQTREIYDPESCGLLRNGELKKETEGLIMAAPTQSLRTNTIKTNIDKTQEDPKCRMCKQKKETVSHIVSECPKLAQREYKRRHDCVAKALHWDLCRLHDINCGNKWTSEEEEEEEVL